MTDCYNLFFRQIKSTILYQHSKGAASIAHAAVLYVRNNFDNLKEKNILLLGVGEIGERTLENITSYQFKKVTIINRTFEKADA